MKAKLYERQEAEWLAKVVGVVGSEEVTHKTQTYHGQPSTLIKLHK